MEVRFEANTVSCETCKWDTTVGVSAEVDSTEADDIFDYIKGYVDNDKLMECLEEEDVIEYFKIEVKEE